jgi:hypothetical protein
MVSYPAFSPESAVDTNAENTIITLADWYAEALFNPEYG